ncbi:3'-5' exonuclease family protein [Nocardia sp. IFM 10818]
MKIHPYRLEGERVTVRVVETHADVDRFWQWLKANVSRPLGVDSETTGLDIYSDGFALRTVQFGDTREAWVLPVEARAGLRDAARDALKIIERPIIHNASFDIQVFERHLGIRAESLWPRVIDTRILAHLIDPRGQEEGGIGHGLEALTRAYIDPVAAEEVKGLMSKLAKAHKVSKDQIWARIDLDHPEYELYAGVDTLLACRLYHRLGPPGAEGITASHRLRARRSPRVRRDGTHRIPPGRAIHRDPL